MVDSEADKYYKKHNIVVSKDLSNIIFGSSLKSESPKKSNSPSPAPSPLIEDKSPQKTSVVTTNGHSHNEDDNRSVGSAASSTTTSESSTQPQVSQSSFF